MINNIDMASACYAEYVTPTLSLVESSSVEDNLRAAGNFQYTPPEFLEILAEKTGDPFVLDLLANNVLSTPAALLAIARKGGLCARRKVSDHPDCPDVALEILSDDESDIVRFGVAKLWYAQRWIIEKLTRDPSERVREAALLTLHFGLSGRPEPTGLRKVVGDGWRYHYFFGVWRKWDDKSRTWLFKEVL